MTYQEIISGTEGFSLVVTLRGGENAKLMNGFLIFKNPIRSYPIGNVNDDTVENMTYRSGPAAFMDFLVFEEYLKSKAWGYSDMGVERTLFADGHSSHYKHEKSLETYNTTMRFFPANSTDKVQPADSFVIRNIKRLYRKRLHEYAMEALRDERFSQSGKIEVFLVD